MRGFGLRILAALLLLASVEGSVRIAGPADVARLLPAGLPETFDTAELATASGIDRRAAQQMTYCLRALHVLEPVGKRGTAVLHARAAAAAP